MCFMQSDLFDPKTHSIKLRCTVCLVRCHIVFLLKDEQELFDVHFGADLVYCAC